MPHTRRPVQRATPGVRRPRKTDTQRSRSQALRRALNRKGISRFGSGQSAARDARTAARGRANVTVPRGPTTTRRGSAGLRGLNVASRRIAGSRRPF